MYQCHIPLRWSGRVGFSDVYRHVAPLEQRSFCLCVAFVALNISEIPESLMLNSLLKKIVQTLVIFTKGVLYAYCITFL